MPLLTPESVDKIVEGLISEHCGDKCKGGMPCDRCMAWMLVNAVSRRDYEWLHEICIEHDHIQIVGSEEDYKDAGCPQFERKDCPECMEAWKKELGGE